LHVSFLHDEMKEVEGVPEHDGLDLVSSRTCSVTGVTGQFWNRIVPPTNKLTS
jgi:hypothetical protein